MKRTRTMGLAALGAAAALALAACGGGSGGERERERRFRLVEPRPGSTPRSRKVVSPSAHKGGTLTFGDSSTPDSTDPGNTYYAFMWNLARLYTMPLMTYKSCPGQCGLQIVPDLATGPGVVSDHGLTWTYHLQPDVKFEDGTAVTSADVKYAVERTFDRALFPLGPSCYPLLLAPQKPAYPGAVQGPVQEPDGSQGGADAERNHHRVPPGQAVRGLQLRRRRSPQSAPVPPSKDTGANYQLHPVFDGPYKFQSYQLKKQIDPGPRRCPGAATTDPNAKKQLASKVVINWQRERERPGQPAARGGPGRGRGRDRACRRRPGPRSCPHRRSKASSDNPISGFLWFAYLNTVVKPLNNLHCREAIEYAANKTNLQTAYGGPVAGGAIASTVAPPNVIGQKHFDLYKATTQPGWRHPGRPRRRSRPVVTRRVHHRDHLPQ